MSCLQLFAAAAGNKRSHLSKYFVEKFIKEKPRADRLLIPVHWTAVFNYKAPEGLQPGSKNHDLRLKLFDKLNQLDPAKSYFTVSTHDDAPQGTFPKDTIHFYAGGNAQVENCQPIPLIASGFKKAEPRRTIGKGKNFNPVAKDKSATGGAAGGGMTEKGVKEYKRKNPGSKLQTAVTTKPSKLKPGSKAAKRRKSFCARSKSWTSERGKAARRRWNC